MLIVWVRVLNPAFKLNVVGNFQLRGVRGELNKSTNERNQLKRGHGTEYERRAIPVKLRCCPNLSRASAASQNPVRPRNTYRRRPGKSTPPRRPARTRSRTTAASAHPDNRRFPPPFCLALRAMPACTRSAAGQVSD